MAQLGGLLREESEANADLTSAKGRCGAASLVAISTPTKALASGEPRQGTPGPSDREGDYESNCLRDGHCGYGVRRPCKRTKSKRDCGDRRRPAQCSRAQGRA